MGIEIIKKRELGYRIFMYLFESTNPKNNYMSKISKEQNCTLLSANKNINLIVGLF